MGLKENAANYRAMVDSLDGLVYICSKDYRVEFANKQMRKRTGYDPLGKACYRVLHERSSVCPWCPNKKVFRGETVRRNVYDPKDERWYHAVNTPVYRSGKIVSKMATITDITPQKRAEALLARREAHLSAIIENQPGMAWLKDMEGRFLAVNQKFVNACGLKNPKEVIGKTDLDIWSRELAKRYIEDDKRTMRTRRSIMVEEPISDRGNRKWFETFKTPVLNSEGKVLGTSGYARDITERKWAEERIRESERLHASLIQSLPGFVYRCRNDRSWTMLYISKGCFAVTGYRPEELINNRRISYNNLILSEYQRALWRKWQRVLAKREIFEDEYPIRAAGGGVRWVWERGQGVFDKKGRLLFLEGYIEDVTERRQAEEALRRSLSLRRATLESTADGILVVDRSGKVEDYNQRFLKLWRVPSQILKDRDDQKLLRIVLSQLKDPQKFLAGVRWYYAHPRESGLDLLEFKDGRILERESHPQWVEKEPVGRVWSFRDITARKRAERAVQESETRFRSLFESSRDAHMILEPPSWKFTSVNVSALRIFGSRKKTDFTHYTPWGLSPQRQPDGRVSGEKAREMLRAAMRQGFHFFEWMHKRVDGSEFSAEVSLTRIERQGKKFIHAVVKDITERKQAEEAIRESRRELRDIIDTVPHLICAKDIEGRFLMANRAMAEFYGMRCEEDLLGEKQRRLHPVKGEAERCFREDVEIIRTGRSRVFSARPFTDSKKYKHFLQTFKIPFKVAGIKAPAVLVVSVDVTEHKKVEDFRNEIVRTLSHELRTPLSIEKGGISLLLDGSAGEVTEEQKVILETVMRNIDRLSRMIDKLLDVARIESGKWKMALKDVDLRDIVRETVAEFGHVDRKTKVRLTALYPDEKAGIYADRDAIAQVLTNLIGNALKFTSKGSVEVSVRVLREGIECNVKDTGIGISPENMAKMFEKFQQFSWPDSAGKEGIGLGLAISKRIVEMHRGRIWAKSVPGQGTTVTFVLPRVQEKEG